ncbi:YggS family pyridoxal phosphate-dependent enzyme [Roseibacillus persicicus]|uniref:Pyridoxal phosphate homeostasis protein n=1 Tax=Roseibacillus persicicus TaxID=454148 RepID=A0A918TGI1_9BACT|nr:YggS family pyridoxal phosphate-dependent enzyme [Roseibacillus persicicus]GHC45118.1 YggS family pyridoxal phosphate enzyme [Roseibacillus persicicus]
MSVAQRLAEVQSQLASAAERAGRTVDEIELLAVSKTFPAEIVSQAIAEGQMALGENRVQEALEKQALLPEEVEWHLIGPLQRNKVRKAVGKFACLQGVDSLKLAQAIDRVAGELGITQPIYLQVKIGGEDTKSGFEAPELVSTLESLLSLSNLQIEGLMTIPPPVDTAEEARPYFSAARELRDQLSEAGGIPLAKLSMGMSGDYQAAIAEGSTMVRIGSAIFGGR